MGSDNGFLSSWIDFRNCVYVSVDLFGSQYFYCYCGRGVLPIEEEAKVLQYFCTTFIVKVCFIRYLDNLLANDLVGTAVESDAASAVSSSTTTGPLCITAEEERAEKFLFGEAHWEYNKVLDYLAARGREFSSWIPDRK